MTRKITLSIPDLLHEKLEAWRKSFNLSQMFQEALTEAIRKKEEFQRRMQEDHDMADIIQRLRREKEQSEGNYWEKGKRQGIHWAKHAHYDDLVYVVGLSPDTNISADPRLAHYFSTLEEKPDEVEFATESPSRATQHFVEGWYRGVEEFWNAIKEKL